MTDNKPVNIRKASEEDIRLIVEHRLFYLEELQGKIDENYKTQLREDLQKYFQEAIGKGHFVALLAESGNKVLGFGGMVLKKIPGDAHKTTCLEGDILNMYTLPQYRRKGISSLILEGLLEEAKNMGLSKVALHTSKDGEKLYRKFGFSEPAYPYLERTIE